MTQHTTCDAFADSLADFLERDLAEPARASMESHALTCAECGSLLADLRKLRVDAASLPVLTPSRDLWSGIAARIDAPVIPLNVGRGVDADRAYRHPGFPSRFRRTSGMIAAAAALVAITSGVTYVATMESVNREAAGRVAATPATVTTPVIASALPDSSTPTVDARTPRVDAPRSARDVAVRPDVPRVSPRGGVSSLASNPTAKTKLAAEVTYDREIGRLRTILQQRRAQIDPVTVSIIERNLKVIDDAIAQCRAALAKDPASRFLMESLNNALESKLELMRTAAMLPSRT